MRLTCASLCLLASSCSPASSPPPAPPSEASAPAQDPPPAPSPLTRTELQAIIDAPDRSEDDRQTDERRAPVDTLAFLGVHPGMSVADIGAGLGYTSELLVRAVGPTGRVIGHNTPYVLERFAEEGWSQRLAKPVMQDVVRVDRPFDDPFGPEVTDLDAAINVLFYHDFVWQEVDRAAHNRAVFDALRPGGVYVIIDAHAADGAGGTVSESLHRIERSMVVDEVTAAGFTLDREADFLRNEGDTRDWNALPWRNEQGEYSDKFVLAFVKPG